ncbi:MAG: hypothetical protein WCW56_02105 [Candidatus Paceibacterota bacterium]|jgi:hypothetical protein
MTKKIIWLLVVVAIIAFGAWWYQKNSLPSWQDRDDLAKNSVVLEELVSDPIRLEKLIKNSQVSIEMFSGNSSVQPAPSFVVLRDGVGEFIIDSKMNLKGDVFLVSVLGKIKMADGYDVFADLAFNSGGTGIFHNVAIFHLATTTANHVSSGALGDRIKTLSATALLTGDDAYDLNVKYLDRGDNEPMSADPTVEKTSKFKVVDHLIKQARALDSRSMADEVFGARNRGCFFGIGIGHRRNLISSVIPAAQLTGYYTPIKS